jgi:hypothetical protein
MQTLKIQIPEGFVIDDLDKASGEIRFKAKPKDVKQRIKTVEDVLVDNGFTQESFNEQFGNLEDDERAYIILKMLAKSLNEGWKPNWNDSNEYKYYAWFEMGGSSGFRCNGYDGWYSRSDVGSRLCFKTRDLAIYAGQTFTSVYKQFMVI